MPQATFPDVRTITEAIAEQLETVAGVRSFDHIPDNVYPPCCVIDVTELTTLDFGSWNLTVEVYLIVNTAVDRAATIARDDLLEPVRAALAAFRSPQVCDSYVVNVEMEKRINAAESTYTGATYTVELITLTT